MTSKFELALPSATHEPEGRLVSHGTVVDEERVAHVHEVPQGYGAVEVAVVELEEARAPHVGVQLEQGRELGLVQLVVSVLVDALPLLEPGKCARRARRSRLCTCRTSGAPQHR